jgi:hypothetical protein
LSVRCCRNDSKKPTSSFPTPFCYCGNHVADGVLDAGADGEIPMFRSAGRDTTPVKASAMLLLNGEAG